MWQNFETDNMDETVDHQGHKISEEHSPKFNRINKQEIIENNLKGVWKNSGGNIPW